MRSNFARSHLQQSFWVTLLLVSLPRLVPAAPLELHTARLFASDLALTGRIVGLPPGNVRFVRWTDLRALPVAKVSLNGEFLTGAHEFTVIFLIDLWNALSLGDGADTLLATCQDGYASVYRTDFMSRYRPFLVLEIDGNPSDRWPAPGMHSNPGPYVIWVSASLAPEVAQLLDVAHKRPWNVTTLEFASYSDRFRGAFDGRWGAISARAATGREIWINSCASCHSGPGDVFGGTKGGISFEIFAAHAAERSDFFKKYIRDPKSLRPDAKMDSHSHYTEEHISAILAFVLAEPPVRSAPNGPTQ